MPNFTAFDSKQRYIFFTIFILTKEGKKRQIDALLDTGAPATEFSDEALTHAGFLEEPKTDVQLKHGFQTQKYDKLILPQVEICSHIIRDLEVYVSHFEKSWGIKALVGLDFFRRFKTTIDYSRGVLVTEPFWPG